MGGILSRGGAFVVSCNISVHIDTSSVLRYSRGPLPAETSGDTFMETWNLIDLFDTFLSLYLSCSLSSAGELQVRDH